MSATEHWITREDGSRYLDPARHCFDGSHHCWYWTGNTIRDRDIGGGVRCTDPAEERVCAYCGRLGLAHVKHESGRGWFMPAKRGEKANDGEFVA